MIQRVQMKFFDFGAFKINEQMQSHDKIILYMLFGAFHITPRIYFKSFRSFFIK